MPATASTQISTFSTALLLAIFEYVCLEPVYLPLQPTDPRFVLSCVCWQWANIVNSTLHLWDRIRFTAPPPRTVYGPNPLLQQFKGCLARCGQNSLMLFFDMVPNGWTFSILNSVIIPHIHHIKSLSCLIHGNPEIFQFLMIEGERFSALEFIEVLFLNSGQSGISSFPLSVSTQFRGFRAAPRLRHAVMHLMNGLHPIDLRLPYAQLTTLDFGTMAMPPDVCIKIMHSTALRLQTAYFYVRFSYQIDPRLKLWRDKVTMHALRTLRLKLLYPSRDTCLFYLLRFPSLQKLWISMHDMLQEWDLDLYMKIICASVRTLREVLLCDFPSAGYGMVPSQLSTADRAFVLTYKHSKTSYQDAEKFFKLIRNVENLHLPAGLYIHAVTLEKIAVCTLLPRLQALDLGTLNGWHILAMSARRHSFVLNAPLELPSTSRALKSASSRVRRPPPPNFVRSLHMVIPRDSDYYGEDQRKALVEGAQALGKFGVACHIHSTAILPLPIVRPRSIVFQAPAYQSTAV